MNADDLIQKYVTGTISVPELCELRTLLKNDKEVLRSLIDEVRLSEAIEKYFAPDNSIDIMDLLSEELSGELSEDELREYAAARGKKADEHIEDQPEKRKKGPLLF